MKIKYILPGFFIFIISASILTWYLKYDIHQAQNTIRELAKDPDSVLFFDVEQPLPNVVCGELNAKNGFGGYAGRKRFIVLSNDEGERSPLIEDDEIIEYFNVVWERLCVKSQ